MAIPNQFGVFEDCREIEIPLKLKGFRLIIRTAEGEPGQWYSSFDAKHPNGASGGLPSVRQTQYPKEIVAFQSALMDAEALLISKHDIGPGNKQKIAQAIAAARFTPTEPKQEDNQLMVVENDNKDPQPRVKRTTLNDQQKIRSIKFEGDKCKIVYATAQGDDAAKHSVECKAGQAFQLNRVFSSVFLGCHVTHCADFAMTKMDFIYRDGELDALTIEGQAELSRPFVGHAQIKAPDISWSQIIEILPESSNQIWDLLDATKQFLAGQRKKLQLTFDVIREE